MSDILIDFDKKNEFPKVKIPKFAIGGICNDAIFPKLDAFSQIDEIVKDIRDRKDNAMSMEFTKCIGELLKKNGVSVKITEYQTENHATNKLEMLYGCYIDGLDFSKHDKVFENKITKLEKEVASYKQAFEDKCKECDLISEVLNKFSADNDLLEQKISELESKKSGTCEKEPKSSDFSPSMEWYENRHQSDCIEINRLNTTIDVLIHKIEYLRQFAGSE